MDNKKTKKRATIRPLIIVPVVFVLISLVVIAPLFLKGYSVLKSNVYDMQKVLHADYGDYTASDDYFNKCREDKASLDRKQLNYGDKVAVIECNNAAVRCNVYYGINRVSKRDGVGMSSSSALFGEGGEVLINGDASTCFKALENVEKGDVFTVQTPDSELQYTVKQIMTAKEFSGKVSGEYLVLTTDCSHKAFAHQNADKLIVVATLGAEEVQ